VEFETVDVQHTTTIDFNAVVMEREASKERGSNGQGKKREREKS
jgi:hypothetical protein